MSDKLKFIKITSVDDANDMFEALCADVLNTDSLRAKRQILGMNGKDSHIEKHKVTINQLLAVISRYDMNFELKVNYVELRADEKVVVEPVDDKGGLKKDDVVDAMERQKEDITNPDLKAAINLAAEKKNNEVAPINSERLPEPPDFF